MMQKEGWTRKTLHVLMVGGETFMQFRGSRLLVLTALLLALTLVTAACGGSAPAGGSDTGITIKVGTEAAYPPFESIDEKTNEFVGFDMDLIRAMAEEGGFQVEIQNIGWDGLIPALDSGEVDAVISAMTITDERALAVTFSDPYFTAGQVIVVKEGSPIQGPKDLVGKNSGVQANTTGQYAVEKIEGAQFTPYKTTPDAFNALLAGDVDAVVADIGVAQLFVQENPNAGVKIVGGPFTVEYYGIAMRQGDTETHDLINKALAKVKASGTYDEIYNKYFK